MKHKVSELIILRDDTTTIHFSRNNDCSKAYYPSYSSLKRLKRILANRQPTKISIALSFVMLEYSYS